MSGKNKNEIIKSQVQNEFQNDEIQKRGFKIQFITPGFNKLIFRFKF